MASWLTLITFLSYLYSYPLDIFSRGAYPEVPDLNLALWIFDWQLEHLSSGHFGDLFAGNMFYPLDNSVVFSITMLSTVILNVPLFWVTGDAEFSFNASLFFSYVLCALGMFLLARRLRLDVPSAVAASLIFSFSEFRLFLSGHLSLMTMQWMPFTLLFIHKYIEEVKKASLYWAALFYVLQITASAHYAIFFSFMVLAFSVVLFLQQQIREPQKIFYDALGPGAMALVLGAACYFPYLKVTQNFGFFRPFSEQIRYGANLETYLSAAHSYFLAPLTARFGHIEGYASPRYTAVFLTLAAIVLVRVPAKRLPFIRKLDIALMITAVFSFFLWKNHPTWIPIVVENFPVTRGWDSLVWQLINLTPITWLIIIRICLTRVFRGLFRGMVQKKTFFLYFSFSLLAAVISLGPVIKINQFELALNPVTTFLFFTFPGFDSIRAISRFSGLVPLGLAITSGIGLMLIGKKLRIAYSKNIFYFFVFAILLLETFPSKGANKPFRADKKAPLEYIWLKNQPGARPVLEWPVHYPFDLEALYVGNSIIHKKPLVNGYGSFQWRGHKKLSKMKDLFHKETLLSLYAFGVRYLLVHRTNGEFPSLATETIGQFQISKKFDDTLIYENKSAQTQFLPDDFWKKFILSIEPKQASRCQLVLSFQSPETYFVSKKRKALKIRLEVGDNQRIVDKELTLYPDLWRDGDRYKIQLSETSCRPRQIFFLIDGEKIKATLAADREHLLG